MKLLERGIWKDFVEHALVEVMMERAGMMSIPVRSIMRVDEVTDFTNGCDFCGHLDCPGCCDTCADPYCYRSYGCAACKREKRLEAEAAAIREGNQMSAADQAEASLWPSTHNFTRGMLP